MEESKIEKDLEKLLRALAKVFATEGNTRAVAVLAEAKARIEESESSYDAVGYCVYLEISQSLYDQIAELRNKLEKGLQTRCCDLTRGYSSEWIRDFVITPELIEDPEWRQKASAWVSGKGITNQGRVRSDNLAPRQCDGLLFRSQPEIHLYEAFRRAGVAVAPLPVFIRGGGQTYRRIEVDFLIIKDGVLLVVEVDGDTVHQESPQEAHDRLTMLNREGAHIERVNARECETADLATRCASRLLGVIEKLKRNR